MAEARDQLQKLTECSICFKTFTDPRMLPCIHTFCLECLKETGKAARKQPGEKLPCPLCRNLFVIPAEGMIHLQKNFFMQHLIDVTTVIQVGQKSVADCDICKAFHDGDKEKTKEATMLCLECGDKFCDICAKMHKLHKSSKSHSIVKIGCETKEDIRKMQPKRTCEVHNQQPLNFYCADCKQIICVSCFVESHASHKCKDVTSVEKEFRQTIELNASKISNLAEDMLSMGMKAEQRTAEILLNLEETEDKIFKRNLELKEMIDCDTHSLLHQLSQIKQKHTKNIETDKEEIEHIYTILKSFETYCTELRSRGSACDVCDCVDEVVKRTNELGKDHRTFIGRPYQEAEVSFKATDLRELLSIAQGNIVGQIQEERSQQRLRQYDSTCYFNAVIQCLCQTFPFVEELCSRAFSEQPLTEAFVTFLNHRCKDSPEQNEAYSQFFEQLYKSSPMFSNFRLYDIYDLFIEFLNILRAEERHSAGISPRFNGDPEKVLTAVDKVFGGHFITMCPCMNCNQPNCACVGLLDITLPISIPEQQNHQPHGKVKSKGGVQWSNMHIPNRVSTVTNYQNLSQTPCRVNRRVNMTQVSLEALNNEKIIPTDEEERYCTRPVTLTECLKLYTLTEHFPEGRWCVSCLNRHQSAAASNSQTTPSATKRTLIYSPPAVLVLHMKRFERTATGFTKQSNRVTYEELLDLGPYCSSDCLRIGPEVKNVWYSLYGVVVHYGSVESGHYTAYVKTREMDPGATQTYLQKNYLGCEEVSYQQLQKLHNPSKTKNVKAEYYPILAIDRQWTFTDEDNTREATLHEVLNQEAFMLFYERLPCS